jgi:hypothetical protein
MKMKFRFADRFENWTHLQYYFGRKYGAKVEVSKKGKKYYFSIEREKDDFVFSSGWGTHPNQNYQRMLDNLPDMVFESDEKALEFVERWIDENVPRLAKEKS